MGLSVSINENGNEGFLSMIHRLFAGTGETDNDNKSYICPTSYEYRRSHEWLRMSHSAAEIGVSDYRQRELGRISAVELPRVGDELICGKTFASVKGSRSSSALISPVSGKVTEVNAEVMKHPDLINAAPYENWLVRVDGVEDVEDDVVDAYTYRRIVAGRHV